MKLSIGPLAGADRRTGSSVGAGGTVSTLVSVGSTLESVGAVVSTTLAAVVSAPDVSGELVSSPPQALAAMSAVTSIGSPIVRCIRRIGYPPCVRPAAAGLSNDSVTAVTGQRFFAPCVS